jgi:raffinose/stachyose/melibiose transport system substrate-binding protein
MKKRYGLVAALGVILVLALVMSGCEKKQSGQKVLEIWHSQSVDPYPGIFQRAVDRFIADNPDFKVNVTIVQNDSYKQKLAIALTSGQLPDVFYSWSGGPMYEYVNAGNIADLTSYMNANNYKSRFLDAAVSQATYQDKIWGIPVQNVSVCTVFYNKELFAKYGITVPLTISELEAACDTFVQNGIIPFSLANKTQWTGSMYFMFLATRRAGITPFINGVDGSGPFTAPNFIYAGEKIQEWVKKGYYNNGFNGLDEDSGQARQLMYNGAAAMHIMGSWFNSSALSENPDFAKKMGIFKFPADEQGSGNPNTVIGTVGDNFYHVAATSKYPDKAFDLASRLIDDQSIKERMDAGAIPPVKNITLTDPILAELFAQVQAAPDMQLWYDQALSPEVADVHKSTSQEIFGLTMSPQDAANALQNAQAAYLKK